MLHEDAATYRTGALISKSARAGSESGAPTLGQGTALRFLDLFYGRKSGGMRSTASQNFRTKPARRSRPLNSSKPRRRIELDRINRMHRTKPIVNIL